MEFVQIVFFFYNKYNLFTRFVYTLNVTDRSECTYFTSSTIHPCDRDAILHICKHSTTKCDAYFYSPNRGLILIFSYVCSRFAQSLARKYFSASSVQWQHDIVFFKHLITKYAWCIFFSYNMRFTSYLFFIHCFYCVSRALEQSPKYLFYRYTIRSTTHFISSAYTSQLWIYV